MNKKLVSILIAIIVLINKSVFGQQTRFDNYTIEQGLSQNSVKCIYQDSQGYIWFGTEDGLNRFDGYTCTVFKPKENDTTSISDNNIIAIQEDNRNNLWVETYNGGLNRFDRNTETFKRYKYTGAPNTPVSKKVFGFMYNDRQHNLWIYNQSVYKYLPKADCLEKVDLKLNNIQLRFFYEDEDFNFWIGTEKGLLKYDMAQKTYQTFKPRPFDKDSLANAIISISEDNQGIFWLGSNHGLYKFDKKSCKFIEHIQIDPGNIKSDINTDVPSIINENKVIWITWQSWGNNEYGIARITKKTGNIEYYPISAGASDNVYINMYKDREGLLWVGTFLHGVYKFSGSTKFISRMNKMTVGSFLEDKNQNLWIGTLPNGLFRFRSPNLSENYPGKAYQHYLQNKSITTLLQGHNNNIWIGTYYHGLYELEYPQNSPVSVTLKHIMPGIVKFIKEDSKNRLWVGFEDKLYCYNPKNGKTLIFSNDPLNPRSISSNKMQVAEIDKATGDIWIGTWNGLNRMVLPRHSPVTKDNVKFYSFKHITGDTNSISDSRVISLCISKKGTIWAGTSTGGLNSIAFDRNVPCEKTNYVIKQYTESQGLPNNQVYGILEDKEGNLWISTNKGLSKFNPVNKVFRNFDINDGLQSNEFFWRSYYLGPSGRMYFGGVNGYNTFYPESIKRNNYVPPVHITGFSIFNKLQVPGTPHSALKKYITETKKIILSYKQSVISFDFVALNYIATHKNQYAYRMVGFDNDWQCVGAQRKATYTNLDPGTYTFHVKAANNDGVWNKRGASITLVIIPPFWKTLWFRIIFIIFIIALLIGFYLNRTRRIRNKNLILQQMVDKRTQEIKEKNSVLMQQAETLNATNALLEERQQQVEEQSEELLDQRDKLSLLNATKDKLFSILSHDLKSPFNAILGFSELLLLNIRKYPPEKIEAQIGYINESIRNTYSLLENLLHWSRSQQGIIGFEPELLKMSSLVEEELKVLRQQAFRKTITIKLIISGEEVDIEVDPDLIKLVIRNLISNAVKYSNKGSTMIVTLSFKPSVFEFSVKDEGIGMSPRKREQMFKISENISIPGTSGEKGTGLGLLLCADFIEKHHGSIWVESEENVGSTFYFSIPKKQE